MRIYLILLLVVLFNIFMETNFNKIKLFNFIIESRKLSFFSCFIFILLLGLLRHESLGVDVREYKNYFTGLYYNYNIKFFMKNINYDFGYVILNKLIRLTTSNFRLFEVIIFCISFGIFSIIIYKESKYPSLSFLIYIGLDFIGFNMCILRQSIACALCFLAYYYLENNKKNKYILLVILAITFHKTAIFFFLTYLLSLDKEKISPYIKNVLILIIFYLGFILIIPRIIRIYVNDYSNSVVRGQGLNLLFFYLIVMLMMKFIYDESNFRNEILKYKCSFGAVYTQTGAISFALLTRITRYFSVLFCLSIPNIVYRSKYRKLYILIYTVMFSIMYIYTIYSNGTNIVPYKSIFQI